MGKRFLSKVGEQITDLVDDQVAREQKEGHTRRRAMLIKSGRLLARLVDENKGEAVAMSPTDFRNQTDSVWLPALELMDEVFGITDHNRGVFDLVKRVKYAISGMRQDHRETLPKILAEQFSRKLSKEEWSQLHLGLARTDIGALSAWNPTRIRNALKDPRP